MRIAIDAYGGDYAPKEVVLGALEAARELPEEELILVGKVEELSALIEEMGEKIPENLSFYPASQVIRMDESPVAALMAKLDASISVCARLVKEKKADALISAGNTGAVVGAATLFLRNLKGVKRAGIAVPYVTEKKIALLMDAGANIQCRPIHLFQYAHMASVFVEEVWGRKKPQVGLLNIGEEDQKGNEVIREAFRMLQASDLNFVGNVEGQDLTKGLCDIVVSDGFVGNVTLKVSEGVATSVLHMVKREAEKQGLARELAPVMEKLFQLFDFAEYGGAPLLGTKGICLICHGRSDRRAIKNAIKTATRFQHFEVNSKIEALLSNLSVPL